ncbi:nascent polypeptide-associated complex subunit alpha, muscle-specific form-like [Pollicipes pollicipes]|uniref:nascent polypeptide-associated complex subunit alpha, muscle-specific form-like n=1 Tax=Pollicipes pollicipes TaxID=41117 RepID=UPI0018848FE8|nr:nascent polypeptide-associated complex subunit alpha, muscle-specific form-like [Pollicipes pollicipes]
MQHKLVAQPERAAEQPSQAQPKPVTAQSRPVMAQPKPVVAQPKPVVAQPKRAVAQPRSNAAQPMQTAVHPKSTMVQQTMQTAVHPKSAAVQAKPTAVQPEQAAFQHDQAVVDPKPAVVKVNESLLHPKSAVGLPSLPVVAPAQDVSRLGQAPGQLHPVGVEGKPAVAQPDTVVTQSKTDCRHLLNGRPEQIGTKKPFGATEAPNKPLPRGSSPLDSANVLCVGEPRSGQGRPAPAVTGSERPSAKPRPVVFLPRSVIMQPQSAVPRPKSAPAQPEAGVVRPETVPDPVQPTQTPVLSAQPPILSAQAAVPPAQTLVPPAQTSVSSAQAAEPPAQTLVPPAQTSVLSAQTAVSPARAPVPPVQTAAPPTETAAQSAPPDPPHRVRPGGPAALPTAPPPTAQLKPVEAGASLAGSERAVASLSAAAPAAETPQSNWAGREQQPAQEGDAQSEHAQPAPTAAAGPDGRLPRPCDVPPDGTGFRPPAPPAPEAAPPLAVADCQRPGEGAAAPVAVPVSSGTVPPVSGLADATEATSCVAPASVSPAADAPHQTHKKSIFYLSDDEGRSPEPWTALFGKGARKPLSFASSPFRFEVLRKTDDTVSAETDFRHFLSGCVRGIGAKNVFGAVDTLRELSLSEASPVDPANMSCVESMDHSDVASHLASKILSSDNSMDISAKDIMMGAEDDAMSSGCDVRGSGAEQSAVQASTQSAPDTVEQSVQETASEPVPDSDDALGRRFDVTECSVVAHRLVLASEDASGLRSKSAAAPTAGQSALPSGAVAPPRPGTVPDAACLPGGADSLDGTGVAEARPSAAAKARGRWADRRGL